MMNWNLSIAQRMSAGFGVLLLVLGCLLAMVFVWQADGREAHSEFTQYSRPLADAAHELESRILRVGIRVRSYFLNPDTVHHDAYRAAIEGVREHMAHLRALPHAPEDRKLYADLEPAVGAYLAGIERAAEARSAGFVGEAEELQMSESRETLIAKVEAFIAHQDARKDRSLARMSAAQQRIQTGLIAAVLAGAALFVLLAWLITQSVRKPTQALVGVAEALERGDWRPALALAPTNGNGNGNGHGRIIPTRDEMARIGHAFGAAAIALEKREQRLAVDHQIAGATAASLDKREVAAAALRSIVGHARAEIGVLYGAGQNALVPIGTYGIDEALAAASSATGVPSQAAQERQIVRVRDIPRDSAFRVRLGYDEAPPREVAALPIVFRDSLIGVLLVASLRNFDDAALEFLQAACVQLGIGLNNIETYERVQRLLDELAEKAQLIQAQNEELQAQNEEIQAQSEEVQAQNEELQAQAEEIRAQNDQLAEQSEHLHSHAKMLEDADQRKTEFLGLLAHELRNPMAGISNSLFVLQRPGVDGKQAANAQAIIGRQTKQLTRLIDDLLDVTRITRGKVTLKSEPLDLNEVLRDCVEDHRQAFDRAGLRIELELMSTPIIVAGDRARLCQIVGNLIDNAVKFSDGGKRVHISLRTEGGRAKLAVNDEGVGIDPVAFTRLFQPFSQGDPTLTRKNGGLGLGLSLVKALTEMHGGTVSVHSEGIGRGARFEVDLPIARNAGDAPVRKGRSIPTAGTPCKILIIEDNPDVAQSLAEAVRVDGHEVRVAHSASEGLDIARVFKPDVLLCDIGLPVMDGYEVARRFRADENLSTVYLVAVTGYASEQDQEQAAQAGFDRHMPKPPNFEELSTILAERAIQRARSKE